jgi:hypothetical protein
MDANERQMISGLFDRMRAQGPIEKDRDAEALINQAVRQVPDSAYMLVQSVLVQEHTLQQAGQRIEELEARVRDLESMARPQAAPASGGFLGGLFGGSKPAPQPMSAGRQSSGFGSAGSVPRAGGSPWGAQAQPLAQAAPAAGGGFMKSAMATAAGVAGGMLLADSIRGMMSGNSSAGSAQAASNDQFGPQASEQSTAADDGSNYGYGNEVEQAADDGGGWGGDDMDI